MVNPVKGEAELRLGDGRRLILVADMEALVEAEAAYGKPLAQMMADASKGFVGASRALLYGTLRARHPELTLRDSSAMMLDEGEAVTEALTSAVESGFPAAKATGGKESANPPGTISGGSGAKPASSRTASGGQRRARSR